MIKCFIDALNVGDGSFVLLQTVPRKGEFVHTKWAEEDDRSFVVQGVHHISSTVAGHQVSKVVLECEECT